MEGGLLGSLLRQVKVTGASLLLSLARFDNFDLTSYLEKILCVAEISTDDRPLVYKTILDLCVAGIQIEELKWIGLLTLFLDESLSIEDLV